MNSSSRDTNNLYRYKWEDLPAELLQLIGYRLDSCISVFCLRAVAPSWRSAISFSSCLNHPPLTLPPPISAAAVLSPITICRLEHQIQGGAAACLVKVVESYSGKFHLLNPLSSSLQIDQFYGNGTLNLLDFRLTELVRGFRLNFTTATTTPPYYAPKKVVLFYNCGILALFRNGNLAFLGFGDKDWIFWGDLGTNYNDIMIYKNQFYAIDDLGIVSWIDQFGNLVQYSPPLCGFGMLKNMVVSDGQIYVVDSYLEGGSCCRRVDMKVYKLDEELGVWVDVKSLGNRVFVLAEEVCFSVNTRDFPSCKGNCIYFVDHSDPMLEFLTLRGVLKRSADHVFGFDDGKIKMVECFPAYKRLFSPSMNWPVSTSSSLV